MFMRLFARYVHTMCYVMYMLRYVVRRHLRLPSLALCLPFANQCTVHVSQACAACVNCVSSYCALCTVYTVICVLHCVGGACACYATLRYFF